jgi:hypothetical protein
MPAGDAYALLELARDDDEERREWEASLHGAELKAKTPQDAAASGRESAMMADARARERALQARLSGRR